MYTYCHNQDWRIYAYLAPVSNDFIMFNDRKGLLMVNWTICANDDLFE